MKKYIVKYAEGRKTFGEYESKEEASAKIMEFVNVMNNGLGVDYFSPFDFALEEVECNEVNEEITCFESAKRYLNLKGPNEKNIAPLIALDQLFTIAEAWNKADGFVPDFSDWHQEKWFPWFSYDKKTAVFVFVYTDCAYTSATACNWSRLCFKTAKRAEQFGKQFIELYNKVFLITNK